jgi:hypothetical protein
MTLSTKRELIQAIRRVYWKSSKSQKSAHLDHLVLVTGLKRNYLNRLLLKGYTSNVSESQVAKAATRMTHGSWKP